MGRRRTALAFLAAAVAVSACGAGEDAVGEPEPTSVATTDAATTTVVRAEAIPIAHTPPGGYGDVFPAPVLTACTEPLVGGAPDLRGLWQVTEVVVDDGAVVADHPALGHVQRIEQCGDRLVVTAGGVIHDMRCDGTEEHGVDDVAEFDKQTRIRVVATYEDGVHVLRPVGIPIEVTRRRDGDDMIWTYVGFAARLARLGPPEMERPIPEEQS